MSQKHDFLKNARIIRRHLFPRSLDPDLLLLRESGYFDKSWYLQNNPDVAARGVDPVRHYLVHGGLEGRRPGPKFDSQGYLDSNPDVRESGINPLVHYLKYGRDENRSPFGTKLENELAADMRGIQERYYRNFGRPVNFRQPSSYTEKMQVIKLAFRNPIMTIFADKAAARELVGQIIGEQYLVPSLGIYEKFEDIPRDELPSQFALKANHGSGYNLICRDKSALDWEETGRKAQQWLDSDFSRVSIEWSYKDIPRKLVVEQLITENGRIPPDLKLHVYDGKVVDIQFIFDRDIGATTTIHYTPGWQVLPYTMILANSPNPVERPANMDQIINLAEKLGKGFPQVRVDFILARERPYFSEMTFYPAAGLAPIEPPEWDQILGRRIDVDSIYDAEYFGKLSDEAIRGLPS